MPLLQKYLDVIRPAIVENNVPPAASESLWLYSNGNPCNDGSDVGQCVSRFFRTYLGYQLTINNIRALIETETKQLYDDGAVTYEQKTAIHDINGHSEQTAKDFYLRDSFENTVALGRQVFDELMQEDNVTYDILEYFEQPPEPQPAPWGSKHPEYHKPPHMKVKWSDAEIAYIEKWLQNRKVITDITHKSQTNIYSQCLKDIKKDAAALPIFHLRHVVNTTRLRNGFDAVKRIKK